MYTAVLSMAKKSFTFGSWCSDVFTSDRMVEPCPRVKISPSGGTRGQGFYNHCY